MQPTVQLDDQPAQRMADQHIRLGNLRGVEHYCQLVDQVTSRAWLPDGRGAVGQGCPLDVAQRPWPVVGADVVRAGQGVEHGGTLGRADEAEDI